MKNLAITLAVLFIIIFLGIQTYLLLRLNDRLDLTAETDAGRAASPQTENLISPDNNHLFSEDHPWNPYDEMQQMRKEMEQIFSNSFSRFHLHLPGSRYFNKWPDADLQETQTDYVVTVNVPGGDASSLNVKLTDRTLSIAIKSEQTEDKKGKYQHRERFMGEYQRGMLLPGPVKADAMKTDYRNGVLTITIPKA